MFIYVDTITDTSRNHLILVFVTEIAEINNVLDAKPNLIHKTLVKSIYCQILKASSSDKFRLKCHWVLST